VTEAATVLLTLMQDLQLHRGLSGAILDGQVEFRDEREAVAEKLQRSLITVGEQFGDRHDVFRSDTWQRVLANWSSLRHGWRELDFATNLSVHSELVLSLVAIVAELAEKNCERLGPARTQVMTEWPAIAEHLGMLRAIGLHLIGQPAAPDGSRVLEAMRLHLHETRSGLASARELLGEGTLAQRTDAAIEDILQLREASLSNVNAQRYYRSMTRLIDQWYAAIRERLDGS
jgi:hypothetical protein